MKRVHCLAALVMVGAIVSGCGQTGAVGLVQSAATRAPASDTAATQAAWSINAFGFDYYKAALASGGNSIVSPASIVLALSMARAGAAGDTAKQMDTVLHSPVAGDLNSLDQALAGLSGTFKDSHDNDVPVALHIANAPFAQKDLAIAQPFLDTLASEYGAGLRLVDFKNDSTTACNAIDSWVSDQTQGRIPRLLDSVDPLTRLVLVNAIYMKAPWLSQFDKDSTSPADFTRSDGSKVRVPMMSQTLQKAAYSVGVGWQAVQIPYVGGSLAMTIVVPENLAAFEAKLDAVQFTQIANLLGQTPVYVTMPTFKVETKSDLAGVISKMGMPLAFDDNKADFSGITTQEKLYITKVIHEANITVDETGTEATAATAVQIGPMAIPGGKTQSIPTVTVDRPFIFMVTDTKSGAILFLGRVVDPSV